MEPRDRPSDTMDRAECAACGLRVPGERIRVLARREDLTFAELPCASCGSTGLAIFVGGSAGSSGPGGDPASGNRPVVSADDVLDMHAFLAAWRGDLRGLLAGGGERREDPGPG
jgi:hypothetical protein